MNQQIQKRQASALDRAKARRAAAGALPLSAAQPKSGGAWVGRLNFVC